MKNNLVILLIASLLFISCGSNNNEEVIYETKTDTATTTLAEDSLVTIINRPSLWTIEIPESQGEEKLKEPQDQKIKSLSAVQLVSVLNDNFPDVQIQYNKVSQDTIYVSIPESNTLTQQLGSTGAYNYMATAVYNLTELQNVKYVHFEFSEGDHAMPGTFSRENFKKLR